MRFTPRRGVRRALCPCSFRRASLRFRRYMSRALAPCSCAFMRFRRWCCMSFTPRCSVRRALGPRRFCRTGFRFRGYMSRAFAPRSCSFMRFRSGCHMRFTPRGSVRRALSPCGFRRTRFSSRCYTSRSLTPRSSSFARCRRRPSLSLATCGRSSTSLGTASFGSTRRRPRSFGSRRRSSVVRATRCGRSARRSFARRMRHYHCLRMSTIRLGIRSAIRPSLRNPLLLGLRRRSMPPVHCGAFSRRRFVPYAARAAVVSHPARIRDSIFSHDRAVDVGVVDDGRVHSHHCGVIRELAAPPHAAREADAHVAEAVIHSAVVAN
jgi:hypothetical protein